MTVEGIRETIKVHIRAAESVGKMEGAMSLMELLCAVDSDLLTQADTIGYSRFSADSSRKD